MRRVSFFGALTRSQMLAGSKVRLRPKRLQDASDDYNWRRDTELCRLDAATPLSISFEEFSRSHAEELHRPGLGYRFAIETLDERHIGNCSCSNIDEIKREAEMGIMIGDRDYWNQGYGADAILILLKHIFSQTRLERIYLKTLNWNVRAQKCFEKCGFIPCGQLAWRDYNFIIMDIHRSDNEQKQVKQDSDSS